MGEKYTDILERMKRAGNLKNDSKVAKALGVTPQALSNYKKRGRIPSNFILRFAELYGISVDWLLTGEGNMSRVLKVGEAVAEYGAGFNLSKKMSLTPEELIFIGKILKIVRTGDEGTATVLKWTVESFFKEVKSKES